MFKKEKISNYLFYLLGLTFLAIAQLYVTDESDSEVRFTKTLQKTLTQKEQKLITVLNELKTDTTLLANYDSLFIKKNDYYTNLYQQDGLVILLYENDTLKYWSASAVAVENCMKTVCLDDQLVKLKNGWFEVIKTTVANSAKNIIGLIHIKNQYPYQNQYLKNTFRAEYQVPEGYEIKQNQQSDKLAIKDAHGNYLFTLYNKEAVVETSAMAAVLCCFGWILILFNFCLTAKRYIQKASDNIKKTLLLLFTVTLLVVVRYLAIAFHFPHLLYSSGLFSPLYYGDAASAWLPSLGDYLINIVFLFLIIGVLLIPFLINLKVEINNIKVKVVFAIGLLLGLFILSLGVNKLHLSLIENSSISFSINAIFSLSTISYTAIVAVGLLLLLYCLVMHFVMQVVVRLQLSSVFFFLAYSIAAIVYCFISHEIGYVDWLYIAMPLLAILIVYFFIKDGLQQERSLFFQIITMLLLLSIYSAHTFIKENNEKDRDIRTTLAQKLAIEQDPLSEYLFSEMETQVQHDSILIANISLATRDVSAFEKRFRQQYFSGYWDKYNIKLCLFDTACGTLLNTAGSAFDNQLHFDSIIQNHAQPTMANSLYAVNDLPGKLAYVARLNFLNKNKTKAGSAYVTLGTQFLPEEFGFPELLLDKRVGIDPQLLNYSFAKYKNNELVNQYGKYQFRLKPQFVSNNELEIIRQDDIEHLLYSNGNIQVHITTQAETVLGDLTFFSYLFSFYTLLILLILLVQRLFSKNGLRLNTLKYRIQFLLVVMVLTSLILFGAGTIIYLKNEFQIKNQELLTERIKSISLELDNKLGNENQLSEGYKDYTSYLLKKIATVFFTDINIYDLKGNIYTTSQSKIPDEGLVSTKMNATAFLNMSVFGKTQFIHDEEIGNLNYMSAYVPFKNKNGALLGYINLPYFARQTELEKEISGILSALINIYVLLFALSLFASVLVANYITLPLKLIQEKISTLKLGTRNEPIDWNENDEIGKLIQEYNKMVLELSNSVDLLAKSERESAWREMAKQVAHEIKNPLTPMKLSVQYLQRIWTDKTVDMDDKFDRITQTLIEQIDTLSNIANTFSSFAIMPKPIVEQHNPIVLLNNTLALYSNTDGLRIHNTMKIVEHVNCNIDKEQLLRVFNNIIKNAIQATADVATPEIYVDALINNKTILFTIKDNGMGIAPAVADKIFTPNFTTKTTGMGLGLAMSKNIIESFGGKIWFETTEQQGTSFYISLPLC